MAIKLVAIDIDGTLINDQREITPMIQLTNLLLASTVHWPNQLVGTSW